MSAKIAVNLIGQRRYWPMLVAQSLGAFNDNFFRYALVTIVTTLGVTVFALDSSIMVPIAASAFTLPIFLFSPIAGRVADKVDRTKMMRFAKFAEIWLMLLAAAGFILNQPLFLIATLFLMGVQSAFFAPAKNAALPTLLEPHELVAGNAMISALLNISVLVGMGLGAILILRLNGPEMVGAGLVGVAVLGWITMRQLPPAPASNPDMKISFNFIAELFSVLRFTLDYPRVLWPLLGASWFWMLAATVVTLIPNFAQTVLGADALMVPVLGAIFTVGMIIGATICALFTGKGEALGFSIAGAFGLVIFTVDLAIHTWGYSHPAGLPLTPAVEYITDPANRRLVIDFLGAAISAAIFVVPLQAMSQRRAPAESRGRLLAAGGVINAGTATLGQFSLAGFAALSLPLQTGFIFIGSVSLIIGIVTIIRMRQVSGQTPSPTE